MIPNFHLKQQKGELTLPQTSQRKNVAGQKYLGWCKTKVDIKASVWQANIVFPLSLQASSYIWASEASRARTRERAAKTRGAEGPFFPLPQALASPLARLSRVYFSRYSPNVELALRLVLIGGKNGNRPHSTRSAHWMKCNFISNSLEQGYGRQR